MYFDTNILLFFTTLLQTHVSKTSIQTQNIRLVMDTSKLAGSTGNDTVYTTYDNTTCLL